jgi:hypothetical protein
MVMLQLYITTGDLSNGYGRFQTNLPNGYYVFRLVDIMFDDEESKSDPNVAYSVESDTWRIPYGNQARGHSILFVNRTNNGRATPQGHFNFLVEVRDQNMDITLTKIDPSATSTFQKMIISFDVTPTESTDTFVSFI